MHSNSPTLLMAKIQLLALLFLSVKGGNQNFIKMLMGEFFLIEILVGVGGQKVGIQCFVVVQWGELVKVGQIFLNQLQK